MIQYSKAPAMESKCPGVLDTPLEPVTGLAEGETRWRGMTAPCGAAPRASLPAIITRGYRALATIARSDVSAVAQRAKAEEG